jgi:hypothetical protein
VPLDQVVQAQAREILHDVVESAVLGVAIVIDLHRVRVGQGGGGLHFALEAPQGPRVAGPLGPDQFDGARPAEEQVLGQVHLPHPARAE